MLWQRPIKVLSISCFCFFFSCLPAQSFDQRDTCDNREWIAENWTANIQTSLSHAQFQNKDCLRVDFRCTALNQTACLMVDQYFAPEDWSGVTAVEMDVYIQSSSSKKMRLELKDTSNTSFRMVYSAQSLTNDAWITATWNFLPFSQSVCRLFIVLDNLENQDIICFSNLRLIRNGQVEIWDSFASPSYDWRGGDDFSPLTSTGRNELISHNCTHNNSGGAAFLPWEASLSANSVASIKAGNLAGLDFRSFTRLTAWVNSDRTDAPINVVFGDGDHFAATPPEYLAASGSWQKLEWNKPAGIDWEHIQFFKFEVNTSGGGSGNLYLDDLEFVVPTPTFVPGLEGGVAIPNPFFPARGGQTTLTFRTSFPDYSIKIFNLAGQTVRTLHNQNMWDGRNEQGNSCEGGVYLFQVESQNQRISGQAVLIR